MNRRQLLISVIGGVLTLAIVFMLGSLVSRPKSDFMKMQPKKVLRKVKSAIVTYEKINTTISSNGRVVSQQSVDLIAEVQGKILEGNVSLKNGQNFSKGDVLVRLFSKDAAYVLQARKSGYLNSIANILPDLKIDYKDEYASWIDFFGMIKIDDKLPDLPKVKTQQLKIFLASRKILSEYYAIKADEVRLEKYTIRAPYKGAIQDVLLEVGSVANPGSRIARIIKTSQLEVEIPVEASAASWLSIGDKAILKTEDGEIAGKATIKRISSFVDPATQSINVYLKVLSQVQTLYPGEYVRTEFSGMSIKNAMEIPRNGVFNQNLVFTIKDGSLNKSEINILKINDKTIVFNGLPEGTELVTEPLANANESMQVQTEFTKPPVQDPLKNDSTKAE